MNAKLRWFLGTLLIALPVDQITKRMVMANFYYGERLTVIPGFFDLTYVRNPGGAFSFFATGPVEIRMAFFVGTTIVAIGLLLVFYRRLTDDAVLSAAALGMILAGAIGNLIDRLAYGEVVDFLDFYIASYAWPTFNVADSCIVVGVGILILEIFLFDEDPTAAPVGEASSQL